MAWTYDQLIAHLTSRYGTADGWRGSLNTNYTQALADWTGGDDHAALQDVIQGMGDTVQYMANMLALGFHGWDGATFALPDALDRSKACPFDGVVTITMANIVDAMFTAEFTELRSFIGLVDAYRQSLWNKPFNVEMWAAIARGFEQWA